MSDSVYPSNITNERPQQPYTEGWSRQRDGWHDYQNDEENQWGVGQLHIPDSNPIVNSQEVTNDSRASCRICHKRLARSSLRRHLQTHQDRELRYKCDEPGCRRRSRTARDLKRHKTGPHGGGAKYFLCPHCWTEHGRLDNARRHMLNAHNDNINDPFNKDCSHGCMDCQDVFPTENDYRAHHCLDGFQPRGTPLDMRNRYMCPYCEATFPNEGICLQHMHDQVHNLPGSRVHDRLFPSME